MKTFDHLTARALVGPVRPYERPGSTATGRERRPPQSGIECLALLSLGLCITSSDQHQPAPSPRPAPTVPDLKFRIEKVVDSSCSGHA